MPWVRNNPDLTNNPLYLEARVSGVEAKANTNAEQLVDKATKQELSNEIAAINLDINSLVPKRHIFGGQLAKLKESLSNPLEQITGIVFMGDSITWGRTLIDNAPYEPRSGTLDDARDSFSSPSFANEFKRYIGENYAFHSTPVLSNWATSPSGESIAEYSKENILYPKEGDFSLDTTGTLTSVTESQTSGSITGYVYRLGAASSGTGKHTISFPFTGERFILCYTSLTAGLNYEVFIDGVSQGVFSTLPGEDGNVAGNNNQREHTFNYIRNKTVEIVTVQAGYVGTGELRVEGIVINKKIRISTQGIIGATSSSYKANALPQAIKAQDNYVICQLGTNDRISSTARPKGSNTFKINLKTVIDIVSPLADLILMCANPAVDNAAPTYSFTMQDVRDTIYRAAKEYQYDMIDNYAIFYDVDVNELTADGLHPNELGHKVIARNLINSLEYS